MGNLRGHRRADMMTRYLDITFDENASCPTWEKFVSTVLGGDTDLIAYVQRALGYTLTGSVREEVLFIPHGGGKNGKTTMLKALREILGSYACMGAETLLLEQRNKTHPTELADLHGARMVICSETKRGDHFDDNRVKYLTGREEVKARRMHENFWSFDPTHKFWICTNNKPNVRETSEAMRRRLRFIPFDVTIPEEQRDKDLSSKLAKEYSGILAWCVRGCVAWWTHGLGDAQKVTASTKDYFESQDPVQRFIEMNCTVGPNERESATILYKAYSSWIDAVPMTQKAFGLRLTEIGFNARATNTVTMRDGLSLTKALA